MAPGVGEFLCLPPLRLLIAFPATDPSSVGTSGLFYQRGSTGIAGSDVPPFSVA